MKLKEDTVFISFSSTSDSLFAEKAVEDPYPDLRLVPTPREISRSCGLSLMVPPALQEEVLALLAAKNIPVRSVDMIPANP